MNEAAAERLVDEVLPDELDWRRMVGRYPKTAVAVAATLGFLVGRRHGPVLVAAVSTWAIGEMAKNLQSALDGNADV